jgi:hypothetical protein
MHESPVGVEDDASADPDDNYRRYLRAPGEYVRPANRTLLDPDLPSFRVTLQGLFAYNHVLDAFSDGQTLNLELVPEPGNPWDSQAMSVEFEGKRIGYLPSSLAADWHDCVRFLNRLGFAAYVSGQAQLSRTLHMWVYVIIPGLEALCRFAHNVGVFAECDAVLSEFDRDTFELLIDQASNLPNNLAEMLEEKKNFAPALSWSLDASLTSYERLPQAILLRLNNLAHERARYLKQLARDAREKAKQEANDEREMRRIAKADVRSRQRDQVKRLTLSGSSQREIAEALGCSISKVSTLQNEASVKPARSLGRMPVY